jgi:hypothetical protein
VSNDIADDGFLLDYLITTIVGCLINGFQFILSSVVNELCFLFEWSRVQFSALMITLQVKPETAALKKDIRVPLSILSSLSFTVIVV